ncbi:TorF family putative porin [Sphingomonas sp. ST-64]|uniref:TorF family putative porin n=1 Tax=Sphingomonas plantiphila TaxID=3163295 RepID=A0ABW8YJC3_9SPHN
MIPPSLRVAILPVAIAVAVPTRPALARDVTVQAAIVSDYRFRGLSLSNRMPVIQGGVDVERDGWQAELWGSIRADGEPEGREVDLYLGRAGSIGALSYEAGARAYFVDCARAYFEVTAQMNRPLGPVQFAAELSYAPAQAGLRDNLYVAASLSVSPVPRLRLTGRAGIEDNAIFGAKSDWEARAEFDAQPLTFSAAIVQARSHMLTTEDRAPAGVFALQVKF